MSVSLWRQACTHSERPVKTEAEIGVILYWVVQKIHFSFSIGGYQKPKRTFWPIQ